MTAITNIRRRDLIRGAAFSVGLIAFAGPGESFPIAETGAPLVPRGPGELDIHHIDTGRGNSTLIVTPDGTSIMIDAGASTDDPATSGIARPDASLRPGQWQARYAARYVAGRSLDYFIATHIHPDHVGDLDRSSPLSADGSYRLTGVSDVDALLPIGTIIDRSFPNYGNLKPPAAPFTKNYLDFLLSRRRAGRPVQRAVAGSAQQVAIRNASSVPPCAVRILGSNGVVWTGAGEGRRSLFPPQAFTIDGAGPNENTLSTALKLTYGRFSYFAGGDLAFDTQDGKYPWLDVETPVAKVAGRTEVAAADHHAYFDACGPKFVEYLDAQAYVIPAWHVSHPGQAQLQRLLGDWPSAKKLHDVFATDMLPLNTQLNARFASKMKSRRGHIVVRVAPGGSSFRVLVVDSAVENGPVLAAHGPYICRRA